MHEVEPLAGELGQILDLVPRPMEMVRIDHQPGIGPIDRTQHLGRSGQGADAGDRHIFQIDLQTKRPGQITEAARTSRWRNRG